MENCKENWYFDIGSETVKRTKGFYSYRVAQFPYFDVRNPVLKNYLETKKLSKIINLTLKFRA